MKQTATSSSIHGAKVRKKELSIWEIAGSPYSAFNQWIMRVILWYSTVILEEFRNIVQGFKNLLITVRPNDIWQTTLSLSLRSLMHFNRWSLDTLFASLTVHLILYIVLEVQYMDIRISAHTLTSAAFDHNQCGFQSKFVNFTKNIDWLGFAKHLTLLNTVVKFCISCCYMSCAFKYIQKPCRARGRRTVFLPLLYVDLISLSLWTFGKQSSGTSHHFGLEQFCHYRGGYYHLSSQLSFSNLFQDFLIHFHNMPKSLENPVLYEGIHHWPNIKCVSFYRWCCLHGRWH